MMLGWLGVGKPVEQLMLVMLGWSGAADAHDAGLVGGRGKPAGKLMLMMLDWSGAAGNPLGS